MKLRLAVPDLISNSYFPAITAVDLDLFAAEGLEVTVELIFPVNRAYAALRDRHIDLVAGSAHSAVSAFPNWRGVRLLCAQAQGMYWLLVMHSDLQCHRGDLSSVKGRHIGAAPWVELGLKGLLTASGYDLVRDDIRIGPVPRTQLPADGLPVNFGLNAATALRDREIDGFWANGMGAALAVRGGFGTLVLDARRGDGPPECFYYTFPSIAARDDLDDAASAAVVRAIRAAHARLKADPDLALAVARKRFPESAHAPIVELIRRDLPFYETTIGSDNFARMNAFLHRAGLVHSPPPFAITVFTAPK